MAKCDGECAQAMKILFVGKRRYTNKDAWSERFGRIYHLPWEWARSGQEVLLWLIDYHTREAVDETDEGLRVWSSSWLSLRFLVFMYRAIRFRPAIVVASGDCYIGLLGLLLCRCTGARFVFDIYDKYDEFSGYVRPFGLDLFGYLRRRADRRLFPSRSLAELYRHERSGGIDLVVANGVDAALFRPLPLDQCRARLGLDADSVFVGYFGGMESDRGVNDLVAAMAKLRSAGSEVKLLICGREHPATPLDQDWIVFRGMVAHADMPLYLNASDVVVVPYRSSPFMDMGASCKIAEYLMCERPIVSTRTPNFVGNFPHQAVELGEGLCDPGDVAGMAEAINFQLRNRIRLSIPREMVWPTIAAETLAFMKNGIRSPELTENSTRSD